MYDEAIYEKAYAMGLKPRRTAKGYSICCPRHNDHHHSALVFKNDGWACCFAGCGRWNFLGSTSTPLQENYQIREEHGTNYDKRDYYDYWLSLEPLDEGIKGLPASVLNQLGWRRIGDNNDICSQGGIFIPAFNSTRTQIPFCQIRHIEGTRRFSFPSRTEPRAFGMEFTPRYKKYVFFTEGNSDRAVLTAAGFPAIALPSASSGAILEKLGKWCNEKHLILVCCSDNDAAGDRLLNSINGVAPYIDERVNEEGCKDYGDLAEKYGLGAVKEALSKYLPKEHISKETIEKIRRIFE